MFIEALVLDEGQRQFQSKTGPRKEYQLSLRDHEKGRRCANSFVYVCTPDEVDKYKGKLRDQMIRIGISRLRSSFNGDLEIQGAIEVVGNKAA